MSAHLCSPGTVLWYWVSTMWPLSTAALPEPSLYKMGTNHPHSTPMLWFMVWAAQKATTSSKYCSIHSSVTIASSIKYIMEIEIVVEFPNFDALLMCFPEIFHPRRSTTVKSIKWLDCRGRQDILWSRHMTCNPQTSLILLILPQSTTHLVAYQFWLSHTSLTRMLSLIPHFMHS